MSEKTDNILNEIANERARQIAKGWTPEHDDTHYNRAIAFGAVAKTLEACGDSHGRIYWPFLPTGRNPFNAPPRRLLIESAAMLVAEIERLDRIMP